MAIGSLLSILGFTFKHFSSMASLYPWQQIPIKKQAFPFWKGWLCGTVLSEGKEVEKEDVAISVSLYAL